MLKVCLPDMVYVDDNLTKTYTSRGLHQACCSGLVTDHTVTVLRLTMILNFTLENKKLPASSSKDDVVFFHSASVSNENISAVGAGNSFRNAKQDSAIKLLYVFLYSYHASLLELPPSV